MRLLVSVVAFARVMLELVSDPKYKQTQSMVKFVVVAWVILGVVAGPLVACAPESQHCNFILVAGVDLTVSDSATGLAICDADVTGSRDSSAAPEAFWNLDCTYSGAYQAGEYELHVRKTGYAEASRTVRVDTSGGDCPRPITTAVAVALSPN